MLDRYGGVKTAKRLLATGDGRQGLTALFKLEGFHAVDRYSVEALVLREPWGELFTENELSVAKQRLDDFKRDPRTE